MKQVMSREAKLEFALKLLSLLERDGPSRIRPLSEKTGFTQNIVSDVLTKLRNSPFVVMASRGLFARTDEPAAPTLVGDAIWHALELRGDHRICSYCGEKRCYVAGGRRKGGSFFYVDEVGRRWESGLCPICLITETYHKDTIEPLVPKLPKVKRHCKECKRLLPQERYFKCLRCQPYLPDDEDDDYSVNLQANGYR